MLADEFKNTETVSSDNEATRDKVVNSLNTLADELTPSKDGSTLGEGTEIPAVTVAQLNNEVVKTVEETTKFKDKE